MRIGTIYQNLWAGYETYFVYLGKNQKSSRHVATATNVLQITKLGNEWRLCRAQYDLASLKDEVHYPKVGYIDLEPILTNGILGAIKRNE